MAVVLRFDHCVVDIQFALLLCGIAFDLGSQARLCHAGACVDVVCRCFSLQFGCHGAAHTMDAELDVLGLREVCGPRDTMDGKEWDGLFDVHRSAYHGFLCFCV